MSSTASPAEIDPSLRARLISDPETILEDAEVMRALVAANERAMGANVVDMRGLAMERLEARLAGLAGEYEGPEFGVSLGVACFRRPPEEVDEVVRRADAAMYRAKKTDGRSVAVWEAGCERSGDRPAGARASG